MGGGEDLWQGDNGAAAEFGEPPIKGNDVFIGHGGNNDADMENGDDIIVDGPGIERAEGQLGFDWISFQVPEGQNPGRISLSMFLRTKGDQKPILGDDGQPKRFQLRESRQRRDSAEMNQKVQSDTFTGEQQLNRAGDRSDLRTVVDAVTVGKYRVRRDVALNRFAGDQAAVHSTNQGYPCHHALLSRNNVDRSRLTRIDRRFTGNVAD